MQCAGAADVVMRCALLRRTGLLVAVRGGGHNMRRNAVCDRRHGDRPHADEIGAGRCDDEDGLVEPGATLPISTWRRRPSSCIADRINSRTGIAGLTLGGGFGWITRKFGLTIDNLLSADVVTANGETGRARGPTDTATCSGPSGAAAGNFGVVTAFEFRLHELGPDVLSGLVVHPFAEAESVLQQYRQALENAPDEPHLLGGDAPGAALPFIPPNGTARRSSCSPCANCGDLEAGEKAVAELRAIGNPIADVVSPHPFVGWQQAFDPLLARVPATTGRATTFMELSDQAIRHSHRIDRAVAGPECEVFIANVGGAAGRVAAEETAFPQRNSHFVMNVHGPMAGRAMDQASSTGRGISSKQQALCRRHGLRQFHA